MIGTSDDVTGFGLAGVDGTICATPDEVREAMERAGEDALVILSAVFARVPHDDTLTIVLPSRP
ncbi:MAG TPA: V-type ATP synthase subunit F [Thermoanaerobaculia bacterium]